MNTSRGSGRRAWLTTTAEQAPEGPMTRTATSIAPEGLASISNATVTIGDTDDTGNFIGQ